MRMYDYDWILVDKVVSHTPEIESAGCMGGHSITQLHHLHKSLVHSFWLRSPSSVQHGSTVIFWLHICTVGGSGDVSSIFIINN